MSVYYKSKSIPTSKYEGVSNELLGIQCTYCYAGEKSFKSEKGELTVSEHHNPNVAHTSVSGIVDGVKVFKSFEHTYGFWEGCDYAKDLLKTSNVIPVAKPIYAN